MASVSPLGPAPGDQARLRAVRATRSSERTSPTQNDRRKVPSVGGARSSWLSTTSVHPERNTSASSMQSPPALIPALGRPGASPRRT
jgi:hypothetical protein